VVYELVAHEDLMKTWVVSVAGEGLEGTVVMVRGKKMGVPPDVGVNG
jgi:hypothetical protein